MGQALETTDRTPVYHTELLSDEAYVTYWPHIERQLDLVPHVWEPWFEKEYLRTIPLHHGLFVWGAGIDGAEKCIFFARFTYTPRGKGLQFVLALGNSLDACLPNVIATFEKLANEFECDFAEVRGREGWLRKLPGFERDYTVMSKQLRNFKVH